MKINVGNFSLPNVNALFGNYGSKGIFFLSGVQSLLKWRIYIYIKHFSFYAKEHKEPHFINQDNIHANLL